MGVYCPPSFLTQFHTGILPNSALSTNPVKNAKIPQEKRTYAGGLGLGIRFGGPCVVIEIYILSPGYLFLPQLIKRQPPLSYVPQIVPSSYVVKNVP